MTTAELVMSASAGHETKRRELWGCRLPRQKGRGLPRRPALCLRVVVNPSRGVMDVLADEELNVHRRSDARRIKSIFRRVGDEAE